MKKMNKNNNNNNKSNKFRIGREWINSLLNGLPIKSNVGNKYKINNMNFINHFNENNNAINNINSNNNIINDTSIYSIKI